MQAWLMLKELWMLVDNEEPCPPTTDLEARLTWQKRAQKAAGEFNYTSQLNRIKNPTFRAYSLIPFASGQHSMTFTYPRSQEQDFTPVTNSLPPQTSQKQRQLQNELEMQV